MRKISGLIAAGLFLGTVGLAMAQEELPPPMPPMSPGMPHIVLMPPPGTPMPPPMPMPEDPMQAHEQFVSMFFDMIDTNHDGMLQKDEFKAWVPPPGPMMPPPGEMPPPYPMPAPGDTMGMMMPPPYPMPMMGDSTMIHTMATNIPPECSAELVEKEQMPQAENVPCGTSQGNLLFRTVCTMPGFDSQAISLPDGRDADCFGIEAQTPTVIVFTIYPESDPGNIIYDTRRDGLHNIGMVSLKDTGVYRIDLDEAASDPGARVTVRFVDHPE